MGSNLDMSQPVQRMSPGGQDGLSSSRRIRRRMEGKLALMLVLLVLAGLCPKPSQAQPQLDSLNEMILRTQSIIDRAKEQLGFTTATNRTGTLLDKADQINQMARSERTAGNLKGAMVLTLQARDLARRALESAEIDVKAHESIRDLIESTRDQIDRISPAVKEGRDQQAGRLLDTGVSQLQRAQDAYRDQDYRKALRLAVSARDLVQRALERAREGSADAGSAQIDVAIDRTDALIDEVRSMIDKGTDGRARSLLEKAMTLQERAKKLRLSQHPIMALRATTQARQSALDGLLLLAENPGPSDVERALAIVGQLAGDLEHEILSSDSEDAHVLFESARQRQADAHEELGKGNAAQALESARIAEGLLRRAAEAAGIR